MILYTKDYIGRNLFKFLFLILVYIQKTTHNPVILEQFCILSIVFYVFLFKNQNPLSFIHETFVFLSFLLHSDIHISIIFIVLFQMKLFLPILRAVEETFQPIAILLFMKVSYFYFGNSNSLSTIDVGSGYVG